MNSCELGSWGEARACMYLKRKGFNIIENNYRTRYGEIDIIAQHGNVIAFVEVKLRKNKKYALAREYVTYRKQQKIILTAQMWVQDNVPNTYLRFDVIEVYAPQGEKSEFIEINHIEDAFQCS